MFNFKNFSEMWSNKENVISFISSAGMNLLISYICIKERKKVENLSSLILLYNNYCYIEGIYYFSLLLSLNNETDIYHTYL